MKIFKDRFKRIILIEPNLISYGHVVEVPLNIQEFLQAEKVSFEVVGNKLMKKQIEKLFPETHKIISNSCFSKQFDGGLQFYSDLKKVKRTLNMNNKDLVIVLTSYINEAMGVKKFIQENFSDSPLFVLIFHQLYPPEDNFLTTIKKKYRREVASRFSGLSDISEKICFFSTPSEKLRRIYQGWTGLKFGKLPISVSLNSNRSSSQTQGETIGFLGDGRYEKGLLLFLGLVSKRGKGRRYIIQNINPRGYSEQGWNKLRQYLTQFKSRSDIEFYNKPLLPKDFASLIDKIDFVILPYHPQSYDARVSGILIESIIQKKIVVATKETWLGKELDSLNVGETFNYGRNYRETVASLNRALDRAYKRKRIYDLEKASKIYRRYYNSKSFFEELERQIKWKN